MTFLRRGRPRLPQVPRANEAPRHGGRPGKRRPLPGRGGRGNRGATPFPGAGSPAYWKSRVLRRQALGDEDEPQGGWVQETA